MSSISLCMIVKNEEENLQRCLDSVKDFVNEIILVDTGSTDLTKEIASRYTTKIYDFTWNDDFSEARNFAIEKATSNWIIWMDADEELQKLSCKALKKYLRKTKADALGIKMLHLYASEEMLDNEYYISYSHRLFRNHKGLKFEGAIHEKLMIGEENLVEISSLLEIVHYGYLESNFKKKSFRNLTIILAEKKRGNKDPWLNYYMATELYRYGSIEEAFQFLNTAIIEFLERGVKAPSLIYRLKYEILLSSTSYDKTDKGLQLTIEQYPDYVELYFLRGIILKRMERYEDAIVEFLNCLSLGEDNPNYLIKAGSGSFAAMHYIGECYLRSNRVEEAREAFQKALKQNPRYGVSLEMLEVMEAN